MRRGRAHFRDLIESGRIRQLRDAQLKRGAYSASVVLAVDYLQAMRVRVKIRKALHELYSRFDALVSPSRTTVAFPADKPFSEVYRGYRGGPPIIPAGNLAGQPALSIVNGFGPHGLPTGLQFTGKAWSEDRLISIAHAYQQQTNWHTRRPTLK